MFSVVVFILLFVLQVSLSFTLVAVKTRTIGAHAGLRTGLRRASSSRLLGIVNLDPSDVWGAQNHAELSQTKPQLRRKWTPTKSVSKGVAAPHHSTLEEVLTRHSHQHHKNPKLHNHDHHKAQLFPSKNAIPNANVTRKSHGGVNTSHHRSAAVDSGRQSQSGKINHAVHSKAYDRRNHQHHISSSSGGGRSSNGHLKIFKDEPAEKELLEKYQFRELLPRQKSARLIRLNGRAWWMSEAENNNPRLLPDYQPWWKSDNFAVNNTWTVVRLREEAQRRSLDVKGLKNVLIERINESYRQYRLTDDNFVDPCIIPVHQNCVVHPCYPESYENTHFKQQKNIK
jgi:hypothetical protein